MSKILKINEYKHSETKTKIQNYEYWNLPCHAILDSLILNSWFLILDSCQARYLLMNAAVYEKCLSSTAKLITLSFRKDRSNDGDRGIPVSEMLPIGGLHTYCPIGKLSPAIGGLDTYRPIGKWELKT